MALAREFRTLASIRHPHIISVLDYGFGPAREPYFTMELLRGENLEQRLRRPGNAAELVPLLAELARGLAAVHRVGVVHRDVAAQNIFVPYAGETKLLDFGVARASATAEAHGGPIALAGRVR